MTGPSASSSDLPSRARPDYRLTSDLARFCLSAAQEDGNRKLAWVSSICIGFLLIGLIGLKTRPIELRRVELVTEIVPVVFTADDTPPPAAAVAWADAQEPVAETSTEAPAIVTVVAADPLAAVFPVPVEGSVVFAPAKFASAPPAVPPRPVPPPQPVLFSSKSESSGSFPKPTAYPEEARRRHAQGKVMLYVVVNADGSFGKVELKDGSGYAILDRHAERWVRDRWRFPPGAVRHYYVPFIYQLK